MGMRDIPSRIRAARSQLTEYSTRMCARRMEYSTLNIIAMLRSESALNRRSMLPGPLCILFSLTCEGQPGATDPAVPPPLRREPRMAAPPSPSYDVARTVVRPLLAANRLPGETSIAMARPTRCSECFLRIRATRGKPPRRRLHPDLAEALPPMANGFRAWRRRRVTRERGPSQRRESNLQGAARASALCRNTTPRLEMRGIRRELPPRARQDLWSAGCGWQ